MATRTIPQNFPSLSLGELSVGRPVKSDIFRRFAQAQNYLWANIRRCYSNWAYDGEGRYISGSQLGNVGVGGAAPSTFDSAIVEMPGGNYSGLCVATFRFPPPPVGNTYAKFQGRANVSKEVADMLAVIRITLHETDDAETFAGAFGEASISADGVWDWSIDLFEIPTNRPIVGKLWIGGLLGSNTGGTPTVGVGGGSVIGPYDIIEILNVSGRWLPPFEFGEVGSLGFEPADPDTAIDTRCADVALLDQVRRQLSSLAGSKGQTEIIQTWFGETNENDTTLSEVGRYTVYVSSGVFLLSLRLYVNLSYDPTTDPGELEVKWDGVTIAVITVDTGTINETGFFDIDFDPVTSDAEHTITIEAKTSAYDPALHGLDVLGVFLWESQVDASAWPGGIVPTDFAPLDEARLKANDIISADLEYVEGARTGLEHILRNNLWLQYNRMRSLVADWRHRTLKRIDDDAGNGGFGSEVGAFWDWTRGILASPGQGIKTKNITVRGDNVTVDGWGRTNAHNGLDGFGAYPSGYSDTGGVGSTANWPPTQTYRGHGRRLAVWYMPVPPGTSMHASDGTATSSFYPRARRLTPYLMGPTFDGGFLGPAVEEKNWKNRARLEVDWPSTAGLTFPIVSSSPSVIDDSKLRWLPPQSKLSYTDEGQLRGRCPIAFIPSSTANTLEGTLFEVELTALLIIDDPLSAASLAMLA